VLIIDDILVTCDATGWATPTNIEFTLDNANGKNRGVATPMLAIAVATFGANTTFSMLANAAIPGSFAHLESGKKIYVNGSDAAGTGAGTCTVDMIFTRATADATISGVNVP